MPRPSRNRARPTRSPATFTFKGFLIEAYNHVDDLPVLSDAPKKRPRHATRGAAAAERRDLAAAAAAAAGDSSSPPSDPATPNTSQPSLGSRANSQRGSRINLRSAGAPEFPPMKHVSNLRSRSADTVDETCNVCLRKGYPSMILRCIECIYTVHSYCLNPPQVDEPNGGVWTCKRCSTNPSTEKHLVNRAFREAVHKYPLLLERRYMEAVADSVQLATATTTAPRVKSEPAELELAIRAPTDHKLRKTENTVILKLTPSDSDIEELRPGQVLPERKVAAKRAQFNRALAATGNADRLPRKRGLDMTYLGHAAPNSSPRYPQDVEKQDRSSLQTPSGNIKIEAGASTIPATTLTAGASASGGGNSSAPFQQLGTETGKAATPRSTPRASRRSRASRAQKEKQSEVNQYEKIPLRLRVRPPLQKNKSAELKSKASMLGQNTIQKESTASIAIRKRLAKARARKAEIRRAKKESQAEAAAMEVAAATAKLSGNLNESSRSVPREPSTASANPTRSGTEGAANKPVAVGNEATGLKNFASSPKTQLTGSGSKQKIADRKSGSRVESLQGDRAREGSAGAAIAAEAPIDKGGVSKRGRNVSSSREGRRAGFADGGNVTDMTSGKGPDGKVVNEVIIVDDDEPKTGNLSQSAKQEPRNVNPRALGVKGNNEQVFMRAAKQSSVPDQFANQAERAKAVTFSPKTQARELQEARNVKRTPEQRTVAKMTTLFQSSAKPGDLPSRTVGNNWGEMRFDAKNEALLTLAIGQKGNSAKRKAAVAFDKDPSLRTPRLDSRLGSAQNIERSRMQAAELTISGRARRPGNASSLDGSGASGAKNSLHRLLIDSATGEAAEAHNMMQRRPSIPKGTIFTLEKSNLFRVPIPDGEAAQRHAKLNAEKNAETATGHGSSKGLFSSYQQSAPMRSSYTDASKFAQTTAGKAQGMKQDGQWDPSSRPELDLQVVSGVHGTKLPSSHSGSQSEPGSSGGKGAQPLTLKRPRKKSNMARTVNEYQSGYRSGVGTMRSSDSCATPTRTYARASDDFQTSRSGLSARGSGDQRPLASGGFSEYRPFSYGRESSSVLSPRTGNQQHNGLAPVSSSTGFVEPQTNLSYRRDSRGSKVNLNHLQRMPSSDNEFTSSPVSRRLGTENREAYEKMSVKIGNRGVQGTQEDGQAGLDQNGRYSMIPDNGVGSGQSFGNAFGSDFKAVPEFEDPMHSDKRLRRSQAPTLSTATRRAQYEQGRAMAMCTPSSQQENPAMFNSSRRARTPQSGYGDQHTGIQRSNAEWTIPSNSLPVSSDVRRSYASFEQKTNENAMLRHEMIGSGGSRPHLVPVTCEPEVSHRQGERVFPHGTMGRRTDAGEEARSNALQSGQHSPLSRMGPTPVLQGGNAALHTITGYRSESFDAGQDESRTGRDGFKQLPPPGFATNHPVGRYDTFTARQTQMGVGTENMWRGRNGSGQRGHVDSGSERAGMEEGAGVKGGNGHVLQQAPQPARTDPSLKNLLL